MGKTVIIDRDAMREAKRSSDDFRGPTDERLCLAAGAFDEGNDKFGNKTYTMRETPLDKMRPDRISGPEYAALQKFKIHWYHAGLEPSCGSVDLNRIFASDPSNFSGMAKSERQYFHRQMYREAVQEIGMRASLIVERVVCAEMPLSEAGEALGFASPYRARMAAADYLRDAGHRLARLWGIG